LLPEAKANYICICLNYLCLQITPIHFYTPLPIIECYSLFRNIFWFDYRC